MYLHKIITLSLHRLRALCALRSLSALCALSTLCALSASAEISVTAIFNPPRIALGDKAQYVVEIKESSDSNQPSPERVTSLPIPQSGGLELSNGRTSSSQQTSIINGVAEYSVTQQLIIDAEAPRVGSFTIPTYVFQYRGETLRAPAVTLQVVERPADAGPTTDELIFLRAEAPEQLYVGQTTTIQLKLYISQDVRLSSLNSFDRSADGFTISELPDSQESSEVDNGRRYRVLTWPLTITPIQTGEQDLNFQFTVSAQVPGQNNNTARDPFNGRGFGGSIFGDIFGRSERFNIFTEPTKIEVLPLPTADQPASFTGAIGDFTLKVSTDRPTARADEPIMLSLEISGAGNFDRIGDPLFPESADWRSYDPEPSFQPRSADNVLRGTKRFDYVLIPNRAGTLQIPRINFTYFEPAEQRYTELSAPPISIEVTPSNLPPSAAPSASITAPLSPPALPMQKELSMEEALLSLDYRPRAQAHSRTHPLRSTPFWLANSAAGLALIAAGLILRRRRRLAEDPAYAHQYAAKQALREATKSAHAAKEAGEAADFYQHAQAAVRLAATCRTQRNCRTANISELVQVLPPAVHDATRALFAAADAHRFSSRQAPPDLPAAHTQLERILKAL